MNDEILWKLIESFDADFARLLRIANEGLVQANISDNVPDQGIKITVNKEFYHALLYILSEVKLLFVKAKSFDLQEERFSTARQAYKEALRTEAGAMSACRILGIGSSKRNQSYDKAAMIYEFINLTMATARGRQLTNTVFGEDKPSRPLTAREAVRYLTEKYKIASEAACIKLLQRGRAAMVDAHGGGWHKIKLPAADDHSKKDR